MDSNVRVALVNMPFSPLMGPAIGLSLLKAKLHADNFNSQIFYGNIDFADLVGDPVYIYLSEGYPATEVLLAEWLFSRYLYGKPDEIDKDYIDKILSPALHSMPAPSECDGIAKSKLLEMIVAARDIVDDFLDNFTNQVLAFQPQVIGLTSTFQQHVPALAFAKMINLKNPSIKLIIGGANCESAMGKATIRCFPFLDAVVSGEGEEIICDLIRNICNGVSINMRGVYTQNDALNLNVLGAPENTAQVVEMDSLPFPDYDDFFTKWEGRQYETNILPEVRFETSRGCWWGQRSHCTFCGLNGNSMNYRSKSADRAMAEILFLKERYRSNRLSAVDNIIDHKYFTSLLPDLASLDLGLEIFYETKANLKREQVELLKRAGVSHIQPGIESLNNHVLSLMKKGTNSLQNIQLLKWCTELGIRVDWNLLYGFPGELPEDYSDQSNIVRKIFHLLPPGGCFSIRLDRFSPNFNNSEAMGFVNIKPLRAYGYIHLLPEEEIANLAYYFSFSYADLRNVSSYTRGFRNIVSQWQSRHDDNYLLHFSHQGQTVVFRIDALSVTSVSILDGLDGEIHKFCDRYHNLSQIIKQFEAKYSYLSIIESLTKLENLGLIIADNKSYLSLSTDFEVHDVPPHITERVQSFIMGS